MAIYQVSTTGSDTGTVGPFKTMVYAHSKASPGDTIRVMPGTHTIANEGQVLEITKAGIILEGFGTPRPIVDGNNQFPQPNTTKPQGLPYTTKALIRVNANNVTVRNLEIRNSAGSGLDINTRNGLVLTGGLFEDLYIHDMRWQCFGLNATHNAIARRITCARGGMFLQLTRSASYINWPGMFKWSNSNYGNVSDIFLSENWGEGMAYPNSRNTTIRRVKIIECYSAHLYFNHAVDVDAQDVFIAHTGLTHLRGGGVPNGINFNNEDDAKQAGWPDTSGVTISGLIVAGLEPNISFGDQKRSGFTNIKIRNATLVQAGDAGGAISFTRTPYSGIEIYNSIIYQARGNWVDGARNAQGGVSMHHNLWYGLTAEIPSNLKGAGDLYYVNPQLVNAVLPTSIATMVAANYKLRSTSPAINKGIAVAGYVNDYADAAISGLPDLGAFEYVATAGRTEAGFMLDKTLTEITDATITASDSSVTDNGVLSYLLDWGDGTTGTSPNDTHTYTAPGTYDVTLTITSPDGTDTVFQQVTIIAAGAAQCFEPLYQKCGETCIRAMPSPPAAGYVMVSTGTGDGLEWQLK